MKKQLLIGSAFVVSLLAVPVITQAHNGASVIGLANQKQHITSPAALLAISKIHDANSDTTKPDSNDVKLNVSASTDSEDSVVTTKITLEEALVIAKKEFPVKTVEKTESEKEDGILIWEIKFTDGSKLEIDATTGAVLSKKDSTAIKPQDNGHNTHGMIQSQFGRDHKEDN